MLNSSWYFLVSLDFPTVCGLGWPTRKFRKSLSVPSSKVKVSETSSSANLSHTPQVNPKNQEISFEWRQRLEDTDNSTSPLCDSAAVLSFHLDTKPVKIHPEEFSYLQRLGCIRCKDSLRTAQQTQSVWVNETSKLITRTEMMVVCSHILSIDRTSRAEHRILELAHKVTIKLHTVLLQTDKLLGSREYFTNPVPFACP